MAALLGAIARAAFEFLGDVLHLGFDENVDLLQYDNPGDIKSKTTLNNTCIVWVEAYPGVVDPDFISMNTYVKCGDDARPTGMWINPGVNDKLTFTDDRVDTITISFYEKQNGLPQFPFPGVTLIDNGMWHERGWGNTIPFSNCIHLSENDSILGKDCKGHMASASVCNQFFADGYQGVLNRENYIKHGWAYYMALPQTGKDPWCTDPVKLIKDRDEEVEPKLPVAI